MDDHQGGIIMLISNTEDDNMVLEYGELVNIVGWKPIRDFLARECGGKRPTKPTAKKFLTTLGVLSYVSGHPVLNIATYRMTSAMLIHKKE